MKNNESISRMKREATNYVRLVKQESGKVIQRSEALERVAFLNGFPNWDTAVAISGGPSTSRVEPLSPLLQYSQLHAFRSGIYQGGALEKVLAIMSQQSDPILSQGWASVNKGMKSSKESGSLSWEAVLIKHLKKTNFFDEQVILMLEMSASFGSAGNDLFGTALSYLKTLLEISPSAQQASGALLSKNIRSGKSVPEALELGNTNN